MKYITESDARVYLEKRYEEQCDRFPTLRNDVDKEEYVTVNLKAALRNLRRGTALCADVCRLEVL